MTISLKTILFIHLSILVNAVNLWRTTASYTCQIYVINHGSHPTWKTWNFVLFFSRPGKCVEFAQKVVKTWNFNSKPGFFLLKFANSMFQASLFKISLTKIILIYFVISTLSTQILIQSQIDLGFHCFYLEITWKIHGILCHKRSENPASVLRHLEIFISKICMKVPGIWHKKTWKNLEFKTKNLEKAWNLVFGKKWEPCQCFLGWSRSVLQIDMEGERDQ